MFDAGTCRAAPLIEGRRARRSRPARGARRGKQCTTSTVWIAGSHAGRDTERNDETSPASKTPQRAADRGAALLCAWVVALLPAGCATGPRYVAPPSLIDNATPDGFPSSIRAVTIDLRHFDAMLPDIFCGVRQSADTYCSVEFLMLSADGASDAFGAGALVGMNRAGTRPIYEVVTRVSARAPIAPFAMPGPDWGAQQIHAFFRRGHASAAAFTSTGGHRPAAVATRRRPAQPNGHAGRSLRHRLEDPGQCPQIRRWAPSHRGHHRPRQAGNRAVRIGCDRRAGRGRFPPVMTPLSDGDQRFDHMHVDGSVNAVLLAAQLMSDAGRSLNGAHLDVILNGHSRKRRSRCR